jgi:SAM-dependent methyltransferase
MSQPHPDPRPPEPDRPKRGAGPALRIYPGDSTPDLPVPVRPDANPYLLAARELLRSPTIRPNPRDLEPYSRAWFEELELRRYAAHGAWLRRVLEFTRHPGESLLVLGPGVGTDAIQYQRHGTAVTVCATPADFPDLVRRNFDLRGAPFRLAHAGPDGTLPFDRGAFDLAYLNALFTPPADVPRAVAELYRVLKPGGKVFALFPAKYDATFWQNVVVPYRRWYRAPVELTDAPKYSGGELTRLFDGFTEHRTSKRHLRRGELPHLWRFLPLGVMERLLGRVLILRTFKPVTAALEPVPVEPAA